MTTLLTLWQALAYALDDLETATLSGGSTTTAVSASWINAATGVTSNLYEGRWLCNLTKGTQSRVYSYVPGTGTQNVTPAVTANAASDSAAVTSLFPVLPSPGAETDYRTITNRAANRMVTTPTVTIPVTTSDAYDMTAYPSLRRSEQLIEVREPSPISGRSAVRSDRHWNLTPGPPATLQNERPFLSASESLEVVWKRPAATWVGVSGVYAESTVGLVAQTDEIDVQVEDWLPFALEEALTVAIARAPGRPNAEWARLLADARADIAASPYLDRSQQPVPAAAPGQAA